MGELLAICVNYSASAAEGRRQEAQVPPARSQLHLLDPIFCGSIYIFNQLFIGEGEERGAGILDALEEEPEEDYEEE